MSSNPFNKISDKIREFRFKREVKMMLKGPTDTRYKLPKRSFKTALPKLDLTKKEKMSKNSFFNRPPKIEKIRLESYG